MFTLKLLILLHIFTYAWCQEELLEPDNFDSIIKEYKVVLVNFYADWCHFCRNFAPIYSEAAQQMQNEKLTKTALFAKVDCVASTPLAERFGVNKYPTVKIFRDGYLQKGEYRGSRTVDDLTKFMRAQLQDPYTIIQAPSDFNHIKTGYTGMHALGVFPSLSDSDAELSMFKKVASALFGICKFFIVSGFPDKQGLYFRLHDDFDGSSMNPAHILSMTTDDAINFVKDRCRPKVRELTFQNAEEITEEGIPLFILFYKPGDEQSKKDFTLNILSNFNSENSVLFLTADANTFSHPLSYLSITDADLPAIVIDSFQHMYKFKNKPSEANANPELYRNFIADLHSGKLHLRHHYGDAATDQASQIEGQTTTQPPKSVFQNLKPNRNRYSMHDEF